jgi:hypothetical protein
MSLFKNNGTSSSYLIYIASVTEDSDVLEFTGTDRCQRKTNSIFWCWASNDGYSYYHY